MTNSFDNFEKYVHTIDHWHSVLDGTWKNESKEIIYFLFSVTSHSHEPTLYSIIKHSSSITNCLTGSLRINLLHVPFASIVRAIHS